MRPSIRVTMTQSGLTDLMQRLQPQLSRVVDKAAHDVEGRAKASILSGAKSGIVYGTHQASAPGESPANDLGNLVVGIGVARGDSALSRIVRSNARYSFRLEFGDASGTVAPRPFMGPALEGVRQPFTRAVRRVIRGG